VTRISWFAKIHAGVEHRALSCYVINLRHHPSSIHFPVFIFSIHQDPIMRVLVTGCGGFLGREIVGQLITRGDHVVGISRSVYPELIASGMEHRCGDLSDASFVLDSLRGIDSVIHTAAVAGVWGSSDYFVRNNLTATENVIESCKRQGIRNLVYTSSPSVTFDGQHQRGVNEQVPYPSTWLCHYPRTKALAEQKVLATHQFDAVRTVALRPHLIWGEDDPHILPRILQRAACGKLRIVGDGTNRVDTVHVVNAAAAHVDALEALEKNAEVAGGRAYFIAQDEAVNCWDWISEICHLGGVPAPRKSISFSAAYRVGGLLEFGYRCLGKTNEPPMTRFVAAQLAKDHYFDISEAKKRLGYYVRVSMAEGLERLKIAWQTKPAG
jgi:nucleoside-diphosphate-sugar epimerase